MPGPVARVQAAEARAKEGAEGYVRGVHCQCREIHHVWLFRPAAERSDVVSGWARCASMSFLTVSAMLDQLVEGWRVLMCSKSCTFGSRWEASRGPKTTALQSSMVAMDEVEIMTAIEWELCMRNCMGAGEALSVRRRSGAQGGPPSLERAGRATHLSARQRNETSRAVVYHCAPIHCAAQYHTARQVSQLQCQKRTPAAQIAQIDEAVLQVENVQVRRITLTVGREK